MVDSLVVGQKYTYKKMCELLDEPYKGGTAKAAQLKEWSRFYKLQKDRTKYTVVQKYDEPLPKEMRKSTSSFYDLFFRVLSIIASERMESNRRIVTDMGDQYRLEVTHGDLYHFLGFPKHYHPIGEYPETSNYYNSVLFNKCSDRVGDALRSLQKQRKLSYTDSYMLGDKKKRLHVASEDEKDRILDCNSSALNNNECMSYSVAFAKNIVPKIDKDTLELYQEIYDPEIDAIYRLWEIDIPKNKILINNEEKILWELEDCIEELNEQFVNTLDTRGKNLFSKSALPSPVWKELDIKSYKDQDLTDSFDTFGPDEFAETPNEVKAIFLALWQSLMYGFHYYFYLNLKET